METAQEPEFLTGVREHVTSLMIFFFSFSRYYGKILIMERIVYFYMIEICLMGKGNF